MRLIFMGTPDFSVPILEVLHEHHTVVAVYAQPPRNAGRGQKTRPNPVDSKAVELGIPVLTPKSLKKEDAQIEFAAHDADVAVVAAYGLILPQPILDAPRFGCINVHASLLPRWRGAAPLQRAIMAGDTETGVTIMQMDAGLDTGAMLLQDAVPIGDTTTAGVLHDTLSDLGARLIIEALAKVEAGAARPEPQPSEGVTYAEKINKSEAAIDFARSAKEVLRHVHGLSPFPGAFCQIDGQRLKLLTAEIAERSDKSAPGTIIDDDFAIACAEGAIRPLTLQRAGKGVVDRASFLRGFELRPGTSVG